MMQRAHPKPRARHQAGISLIELLVGLVIGFFPMDEFARPEAAYRAGFAVLAASLVLGLAGWLLLPRAKP